MNTTYVLRQSDSLVFNNDSEIFTFTARRLADVKRRAFRKQFHEDSNLRLEDGNVEALWVSEIQERYRAIQEGTVTSVPADEAMRQARERLRR